MRILSLSAVVCSLVFAGCTKMPEYVDVNPNLPTEEEIRKNNESIFGTIDPNQDWNMFSSGSITILADAPLDNIAKVQVLTESPFFNDNARVLSEAKANKGDEVTLTFDAPYDLTRLIAACVDNNGKYYIQGFNIGDKTVTFMSSTAGTRGAAFTSAGTELPNISLDFSNSFRSYNAERTLSGNSTWIGKNWENDRLWQPTGSGSSNGWTISNSTIYRNATPLSAEEEETLQDIFNAALGRNTKTNLELIKESSRVRLYGNHLVSTGDGAITLSPVQAASTEAYWCDIYYYYYRPEDIPTGTSEADYIKTLPKFKAIDVNDVRQGISAVTGIAKNKSDVKFLRQYEYLLPFYGDASEFTPQPSTLSTNGYTTDGKFYRIYNISDNATHYITNGNPNDDLKGAYTENIEEQLWQIFENKTEGRFMFYNVGSKKFLWCNNGRPEIKTLDVKPLINYTFYITDSEIKSTESRDKVYLYSYNQNKCIKSDAGTKLGVGDKKSTNQYREWTFELYADSSSISISDIELPLNRFPAGYITPPSAKPSTIIPAGYHVGFMVRKDGGAKVGNKDGKGDDNLKGCVYGYGALNTEINTYGNFKNSVKNYGMELNSPRIATFTANNTLYLCFEEGTDAQYSDIIVEVGSPGETGVDMSNEDLVNVEYMSYMMCFEDSPKADYDLNDVVLRFQRLDDTHVEVKVLACGAYDELYLRGLEGQVINSNTEIHAMLKAEPQTFVNTEENKHSDIAYDIFPITKDTHIWQFMQQVSVFDKTTGIDIKLSEEGDSPCAIIVPGYINYPMEKVRITEAYPDFKAWANNATEKRDWYKNVEEKKVYKVTKAE